MDKLVRTLLDALDFVEYGVLLLDEDQITRFANRTFRSMWSFEEFELEGLTFEQLMRLPSIHWTYDVADGDLDGYIAMRVARVRDGHDGPRLLRLTDGRVIKFECVPLPEGGRMVTYADETQLVRTVEQLEAVVNIDHLTKVYNRRYLFQRGEQELAVSQRHGNPLSLVMFDIDHFKTVNDVHGHAAGDRVLQSVARSCAEVQRQSDLVGRVGGEEFAILLPQTPIEAAVHAAERLRQTIASMCVRTDATPLSVTASFGVAFYAGASDFHELLQRADKAMYRAKRDGRNRVVAAPVA